MDSKLREIRETMASTLTVDDIKQAIIEQLQASNDAIELSKICFTGYEGLLFKATYDAKNSNNNEQ